MKIWGYTDPRLLSRQHLLGEHTELHTMLNGGWPHHPESKRFQYPGGHKFLILRHELLRLEMDSRWPGRHTVWAHPTAVAIEHDDIEWLERCQSAGRNCTTSSFPSVMDSIGFPKSPLSYDTPWDKYDLTQCEYEVASELGLPMKALEVA